MSSPSTLPLRYLNSAGTAWVRRGRTDIGIATAATSVALQGAPTLVEQASGASVAVPVPAGVTAGEFLVAAVATSDNATLTIPSGWTTIPGSDVLDASGPISCHGYYRVATAAEPASYTWSGITGTRTSGIMQRFSGVDTTTPLDTTAGTVSTGGVTTASLPSLTTATSGAVVVSAMALNANSAAALVEPSGVTEIQQSQGNGGRRLALAYEARPIAGATGTRVWTENPTTTALQFAGWTIALRVAGASTGGGSGGGSTTQPYGATPQGLANWVLKFSDDFDGTALDTTKWANLDGWSMNSMTASAANVSVANSILSLQMSDASTGAYISTENVWGYNFNVGDYAEAKCYFPGDGTNINNWPAWWTSGQAWPSNGELDIAEVGGKRVTVNYHYGPAGSTSSQLGPFTPTGYWGDAWHVYAVHRTASAVNFYWDGVLVKSWAPVDSGGGHVLLLNSGYSSALATGAAGAFKIDYVRVWQPA